MAETGSTIVRGGATVRIRQVIDQLRHQLSFVPALYVIAAIALVQVLLLIDRRLVGDEVPNVLETTVESARSVFAVLAGGLITAITLLLSMTLITVQLASSQFSPRTIRDWLGDRVLTNTVGLAMGSTVFALLAMRSTRTVAGDDATTVPHVTLTVGVVLGIASLLMLVRSVDHIANSVRVGSVSRRIARRTIAAIEAGDQLHAGEHPVGVPAARPVVEGDVRVPAGSAVVESPEAGWVQQVDVDVILDAIPDGTRAVVAVPIGGFVPRHGPLVWLSPPPSEQHPCRSALLGAFALGDTRTLQQDVAFGLDQLTDIAVRALSPGVNDPGTANEIIMQLGDLLLRLWGKLPAQSEVSTGDRAVVFHRPTHEEYLRRACDPIRRYGAADPTVVAALLRMLTTLRDEAVRRSLAGPIDPIERLIESTAATSRPEGWSTPERQVVADLGSPQRADRLRRVERPH